MNIKSIKAEGFKSIYNSLEIDISSMKGLWKIEGNVGVGKTTIGEIILFGLFGSVKDKNVKDLISWGLKTSTVEICLESRNHNIYIKRVIKKSGSGEFSIIIDGEELNYTDKKTAQRLLETDYYDVTKMMVESLCIISLNNFKSIAQLNINSQETRKFIDDIFGFAILNDYINESYEMLQKSNDEAKICESKISTYKSQLSRLESGQEVASKNIDGDIESIEEQLVNIDTNWTGVKNVLLDKITQLKSEHKTLQENLETIKDLGTKIKAQIDSIKKFQCPECGYKNDVPEDLNNRLSDTRDKYNELNIKFKEKTKEVQDVSVKYSDEEKKVNELKNKLKYKIKEIKSVEEARKLDLQKQINDLKCEIDTITTDFDHNINKDKGAWKIVYDKLNKQARSKLLSFYIPTLNNNINNYLECLGQPYVITFNELFECNIDAFGCYGIPISSLSTGQIKIVNTAIIFGILKTVLSNANFNISFLDELFSNMHEELRNITCEMLLKNLQQQVIFIITHANIDDELFSGKMKLSTYPIEINSNVVKSTKITIS